MTNQTTEAIASARLSPLTGEFSDQVVERQYLRSQWDANARQIRIVLVISILAYLFASYQNYVDIGASTELAAIALLRLVTFSTYGWAIMESFASFDTTRLPWAIFCAEVFTGLSETVEMLGYHEAGFTISLISAPFFFFIILIFYAFVRIRWMFTTVAALIGGSFLVAGYAYIAQGHLESIIRHPVMMLGVIAIGGGVVRSMNRVNRHNWQQGQILAIEMEERRLAEERAIEASKAKGEFLAVMSHEIRTPLNSILAMSEILSEDSELQTARTQRQLDILNTAGSHLNDLINDVLDFSRIEADATTIHAKPFKLRSTIDKAISSIQSLAGKKGLSLNVHVAADLPEHLLGDAQRIRQILINLVGNAIKFTPEGSIDVRVGRCEETPKKICFAISDTGVGIAEDDLKKIFQPFQQADSTSTRKYQGTGLGLAISRNLIEKMGGSIHARNQAKGGAVFEFNLPLETLDEPRKAGRNPGEHRAAEAPSNYFKALIVEDSRLNRLVLEEYLADVDCDLVFAEDGHQGLAAYQTDNFDIVLMDLQMPDMDGIETARLMRKWESNHGIEPLPIVMVTADNLDESRNRAKSAGVSDYITKPMSRRNLYDMLNQHTQTNISNEHPSTQMQDVLSSLLPRFFSQMQSEVMAMGSAIEDNDIAQLNKLAHAAKGDSQMFGFDQIADAARKIELAAEGETSISPALHSAWSSFNHVVTQAVETYQASGKATT